VGLQRAYYLRPQSAVRIYLVHYVHATSLELHFKGDCVQAVQMNEASIISLGDTDFRAVAGVSHDLFEEIFTGYCGPLRTLNTR